MKISRRNLIGSGIAATTPGALTAHAKESKDSNEINFDKRAAIPEYRINSLGQVIMNPNQVISNVTCFGCTTQCGVRVRVDKRNQKVIRVTGNPFHPLATADFLPMKTSIRDSLREMSAAGGNGQLLRPTTCGRGNAMLEMMVSPHRILSPLKRVGPRNSGRWQTISFEQLIKEVVYGGDLFGEGRVAGLKELRDLKTPIDSNAPELGTKVNQVGLMMCTNEGRDGFSRRFWNKSYGTINYVGHGSWCGGSYRSGSAAIFGDMKKMPHGKPDFENAEFILFIGTAPGQAGNPFKRTAELVAKGRSTQKLSYVVVDPVMTNAANAASGANANWIPIYPGTDGALVMGMIQWMISQKRINSEFLSCPNIGVAKRLGFPSFSSASWLVVIDEKHKKYGKYVRASDLGLDGGKDASVVVMEDGSLQSTDQASGPALIDISKEITIGEEKVHVKSAFRLLKEESFSSSIHEYSAACGVPAEQIAKLAQEFTSHGVKSSAIAHGGMMSGSGFLNAFSVITLNVLIGNLNCRGGFVMNGGGFKDAGKGPRYDLDSFDGQIKPKGIPFGRNVPYTKTSEFKSKKALGKPYPASDLWFPNAPGLGTEWFASLSSQYPYPLKALILWMCNPVYGMPGSRKIAESILADPHKLPLIVSIDCFINESNAFADYIVPDSHMYETWGWVAPWNGVPTKTSAARWPVVEPRTSKTENGEHICMETFILGLAKEMNLPGFGPNAIKDQAGMRYPLETPEDWYFRGGANIAFTGKKPTEEATDDDLSITGVERLVPKLKSVLKADEWKRVANLYAHGGRFENHSDAYDPDNRAWMRHRFDLPQLIWNENVGSTRNTLSGKFEVGCAAWREPSFGNGKPMRSIYPVTQWPFLLMSFKSTIHSSYSLDSSLSSLQEENPVLLNPRDAQRLKIKQGDRVKISTPAGSINSAVLIDPGVKSGVLAIEHGFGHRDLGARTIIINGTKIPGNPHARHGVDLNEIGLTDPTRKGTTLWVNSVSGACVRNGIPAKIEVQKV